MTEIPNNYDTYLGAIQLIASSTGLPIEPMSEVQFMEACEHAGYVHTSLIDMDAFEAAFSS